MSAAHDCTTCHRPIPDGKAIELRGLLYCPACIAKDPKKFAAVVGRKLTGVTATGYRSRKIRGAR